MIRGVNQIDMRLAHAAELAALAGWLGADESAAGAGARRWQACNINLLLHEGAMPGVGALRPHEAGIAHFCVQARDPWPLAEALGNAGMAFTAPLTTLGNGTHYAYGALPSGPIVEIESATFVPEDLTGAWVAHIAFATPDLPRLMGFYAGLTGRRAVGGGKVPPRPENAVITGYPDPRMRVGWVPCGNIMLEFWCYETPATTARAVPVPNDAPGYPAFHFEVTGLGDGTDALAHAGVGALSAVTRDAGGVLHAEGVDPDGNRIGFVCFDEAPQSLRALAALADPWLMPRLGALRATLPPPHYRPEMTW